MLSQGLIGSFSPLNYYANGGQKRAISNMVGGLNPGDVVVRLELHSCDFCPFYNQAHLIERLDFVQCVLHNA